MNWKTTVAGGVASVLGFLATVPALAEYKELLAAAGSLALGAMAYFAKDKDVTGGKRPQ